MGFWCVEVNLTDKRRWVTFKIFIRSENDNRTGKAENLFTTVKAGRDEEDGCGKKKLGYTLWRRRLQLVKKKTMQKE